jgi:hypothetical protein
VKKVLALLILISSQAFAHSGRHEPDLLFDGNTPEGLIEIPWQAQHIDRVVTAGYPDSLGLASFTDRQAPELQRIENKSCVKANFLSLGVVDDFAFDLDEEIELQLLIDTDDSGQLFYTYDRAGKSSAFDQHSLSQGQPLHQGSRLYWQTLTLPRARFANRGMHKTDLSLTTRATLYPEGHFPAKEPATLTLCDIRINRSFKTPVETQMHKVKFTFTDDGTVTPVRVGLYHRNGKAVLANNQALPIGFYSETRRDFYLRSLIPPFQPWPHENRHYFYSNGNYTAQIADGDYQLVVSKGPEYFTETYDFSVNAGVSPEHHIRIKRWNNLPALGWYSGDVHIHMPRQEKDNVALSQVLSAEDLHLSNLLEMTNLTDAHFKQYAYGDDGEYIFDDAAITSGSEGPRTAQRGHTLALNIEQPLADKQHYFLYHRFLKAYQQQGGLTGYAHLGSKEFQASWGLALDAPFGLVDFVEIMQNGALRTEFWYERLNLGERIAPAAGSDFPYFDQPGAVRSYVKLKYPFTPDKWFAGLQQGHTYITNGPQLTLRANRHSIGSRLTPSLYKSGLTIDARVQQNPDLDGLQLLELIYCGQVIKTIEVAHNRSYNLRLTSELDAIGSGWLAIRVRGRHSAMAHSAPIYLEDETGNSWCPAQVSETINLMQERLQNLRALKLKPQRELEFWQNGNLQGDYERQQQALDQRIDLAERHYHALQARFNQQYQADGKLAVK